MANGWTDAAPIAGSDRSPSEWAGPRPPTHAAGPAFITCALDGGVPIRDVQIAARHADPRTTMVYDHRRQNFDKNAAYVVVAFVAGG